MKLNPKDYNGKYKSYLDASKFYEDGKHRRYSLLFAVNGAAAAIVGLFPKETPDSLKKWARTKAKWMRGCSAPTGGGSCSGAASS